MAISLELLFLWFSLFHQLLKKEAQKSLNRLFGCRKKSQNETRGPERGNTIYNFLQETPELDLNTERKEQKAEKS